MGNSLGLTPFETVETISGWNFVALNLFATKFWAGQFFKKTTNEISEETILAMRYMGLFLAFGRSFQYLCHTGTDKELKYKGYLLSSAVWLASACLVVIHWDIIDPIQAYMNLPFYLAMGGGFFLLAPGIREKAADHKKK